MSVIWTPGRGSVRQPASLVGVDWSNPITNGLVFAETPTSPSGEFIEVGTVARASMPEGSAYGFNANSYLKKDTNVLTNYPLTFLAIFERRTATTGSLISIGQGTQRQLLYLIADGRLSIFSGSGGTKAESQAASTPVGVPVWGAARVFSASKRDLWRDGVYRSQSLATVTTTESNVNTIGTYWNNNASALPFDGKINLAVAWNRALSNDELRELYHNPWQLFKPRTRTIFLPAAGGTPVLSAAFASTITSSSIVPNVTVTI